MNYVSSITSREVIKESAQRVELFEKFLEGKVLPYRGAHNLPFFEREIIEVRIYSLEPRIGATRDWECREPHNGDGYWHKFQIIFQGDFIEVLVKEK